MNYSRHTHSTLLMTDWQKFHYTLKEQLKKRSLGIMNLSILALYRGLALFHIRVHIEIPSVLYTFLEICVPTPNFVACRISVYDTLKFATKLGFFFI